MVTLAESTHEAHVEATGEAGRESLQYASQNSSKRWPVRIAAQARKECLERSGSLGEKVHSPLPRGLAPKIAPAVKYLVPAMRNSSEVLFRFQYRSCQANHVKRSGILLRVVGEDPRDPPHMQNEKDGMGDSERFWHISGTNHVEIGGTTENRH
jgi:hypothetical protein